MVRRFGQPRRGANPSADLDQCANDPAPSPSTDGCSASASDWVNGNLGASKSSYFEGDSIPYRMTFDNLTLASTRSRSSGTRPRAASTRSTTSRPLTGPSHANPCLGVQRVHRPHHLPDPGGSPGDRRRRHADRRATSRCTAERSPASAPTRTPTGRASRATSPRGSRSPSPRPSPTRSLPGAATSRPGGLGPGQLRGRDPGLAVPHAADRPRRLGRQPGPLALGGGGYLPRLDHGHQGRDAEGSTPLQLHRLARRRCRTSRSSMTAPARTPRSSPASRTSPPTRRRDTVPSGWDARRGIAACTDEHERRQLKRRPARRPPST